MGHKDSGRAGFLLSAECAINYAACCRPEALASARDPAALTARLQPGFNTAPNSKAKEGTKGTT